MIRCVRIWTGEDQNSHVEEGWIDLKPGAHGDLAGRRRGGDLTWRTLDFSTRGGQHFVLAPGDILLAEDTTGGGHTWRLVDDQPWRRLYVVLGKDAPVPFKRATPEERR